MGGVLYIRWFDQEIALYNILTPGLHGRARGMNHVHNISLQYMPYNTAVYIM
jgi:hypothetical protein